MVDHAMRERRGPFEGGALFSGPEGLARLSVSSRMSSPSPHRHRTLVATTTFGEMFATRIRSRHLHAERTPEGLDDPYSGYAQIGFVLSGRMRIEQSGRQSAIGPGTVSLLVGSIPFRTRIDDEAESVQLYLPLRLMLAHGYAPEAWAGLTWESTPSAMALHQVLRAVTNGANPVPASSATHVGHALREFALAALHEAADRVPAGYDAKAMYRERAKAVIADRFADPSFDVAALAEDLRVSPRYLHALFHGEDLSAGALLRETRIRLAGTLLAGSRTRNLTIAAIARLSGFGGDDQFSRAFRRAHGVTPSEYRAQHRGSAV
ncbi:helix-turn-helix domain-containing protein [Microbacterium sp. Au-Mic1]|uniref:helix-turn-helix domain-containing protein n=1 Tax=Microbacterium sp. Au-Mic1 TaxID=2906457 RepID=UPI001E516363|nr:helix-turn-helix domain-containing protein [Microbacterium sp. Au-Mic1]MCE4026876.1 helix-turn-helix domain-containing protein [Microbacterium sp. Au-Mic1]